MGRFSWHIKFLNVPDYCTHKGADVLCDVLTSHWKKRGYDVEFHKESSGIETSGGCIWGVRSTLIAGLPALPARPTPHVRRAQRAGQRLARDAGARAMTNKTPRTVAEALRT